MRKAVLLFLLGALWLSSVVGGWYVGYADLISPLARHGPVTTSQAAGPSECKTVPVFGIAPPHGADEVNQLQSAGWRITRSDPSTNGLIYMTLCR